MEEEFWLVDIASTNIILREIKYFQILTNSKVNVTTIAGHDPVIVGSGRAIVILPMGTQLVIEDAVLYPNSTRTLLSYKDIRRNSFHIETHNDTKMNIYSSLKMMEIPSNCLRKFLHYQLDCISHTSNPYNMLHIR
jgi:hypothetical protein